MSHPIRYQCYNHGIFHVKIIAIKNIISRRYLLITSKANSRAGFSRPIVKSFRRKGPMRTNYLDVNLSKNIQHRSSMKRKNVESQGKTALDRQSIMRSGCLLSSVRKKSFCFRIYLDVECYHLSSYKSGSVCSPLFTNGTQMPTNLLLPVCNKKSYFRISFDVEYSHLSS